MLVPSSHMVDTNSMLDQQQQQQYSNRKRCCGTASNPAPGELQADEVVTYLHGLSSHLANNQLQHASTVLGAAGWQVSCCDTASAKRVLGMLLDGQAVQQQAGSKLPTTAASKLTVPLPPALPLYRPLQSSTSCWPGACPQAP